MDTVNEILRHGFISPDMALLANRVALGLFFVLARFRFIYDPSRPNQPWFNEARRASFAAKLDHCGCGSGLCTVFLAVGTEVVGGLALIAGLLTVPAALGMFVVLLLATKCTAYEKVMKQGPVDSVQVCEHYLWTVEPLYIVMAVTAVVAGPGAYSLDYLFFG